MMSIVGVKTPYLGAPVSPTFKDKRVSADSSSSQSEAKLEVQDWEKAEEKKFFSMTAGNSPRRLITKTKTEEVNTSSRLVATGNPPT